MLSNDLRREDAQETYYDQGKGEPVDARVQGDAQDGAENGQDDAQKGFIEEVGKEEEREQGGN